MVWVVFLSGKVVRYNDAIHIKEEGESYVLHSAKHLIAYVPKRLVERVEGQEPCAVLKAKKAPKRSNYHG